VRLALLLALALLAAGCVRPEAEPLAEAGIAATPTAPEASSGNETVPVATTGSLGVLAVFADRTPLAGVEVAVANETRTTDGAGVARFDALPAGTHTLLATKTAHRAAQLEVSITAGAHTDVEVVLAAEAGGQHAHAVGFEAHSDTYVFEGHFDCTAIYVIIPGDCLILIENVTKTAGLPDPASNTTTERNIIDFPLDVDWSRLVVEMTWEEPSPPTTDGMTLALEPAEAPADGHAAKYARASGVSPLRIDLLAGVKHETATEEDMPNPLGGEVIRARSFVKGHAHNPGGTDFLGVGATTDFRFTLTVTITYG
jgi:hypothetical protein